MTNRTGNRAIRRVLLDDGWYECFVKVSNRRWLKIPSARDGPTLAHEIVFKPSTSQNRAAKRRLNKMVALWQLHTLAASAWSK